MNRKFLLVMAVLIGAGFGIYAYLGGFKNPTITVTSSEALLIAGQAYEGTVKDDAFGNAFQRAAQAVANKELDGVLGNVYYNNPESKSDTIKAFVGVVIQDSTINLPEGFTLLHVPGGRKVLRSEIEAHYMVAPGKLYEALFDYAKEQKLQLENFYVEWFPSDRKGIVEVPVKE